MGSSDPTATAVPGLSTDRRGTPRQACRTRSTVAALASRGPPRSGGCSRCHHHVSTPGDACVNAVSVVEDEVRELVRRRGLDPVAEPGAVRRLVDEVVADYDERSARPASLPPLRRRRGVLPAPSTTRSPASARCSRYLDDPAVEEIWINEPGRVFVARHGVARADHDDPRRADEVRDLVERMLKTLRAPGRPLHPVRRRDAAGRVAAARRHPRHHPASTGRSTSASSWSGAGHLDELVGLGTLTPAGGALPRGVGRRRAQRPGRRRHPGRQDDAAQLPRRGDPGARAGRHLRGGLRAAARRCPTSSRCRAASPTSRAPARSRCAAWSRRRCGCARPGSSSARSGRRRASTC